MRSARVAAARCTRPGRGEGRLTSESVSAHWSCLRRKRITLLKRCSASILNLLWRSAGAAPTLRKLTTTARARAGAGCEGRPRAESTRRALRSRAPLPSRTASVHAGAAGGGAGETGGEGRGRGSLRGPGTRDGSPLRTSPACAVHFRHAEFSRLQCYTLSAAGSAAVSASSASRPTKKRGLPSAPHSGSTCKRLANGAPPFL